jgi:hypothetical protein
MSGRNGKIVAYTLEVRTSGAWERARCPGVRVYQSVGVAATGFMTGKLAAQAGALALKGREWRVVPLRGHWWVITPIGQMNVEEYFGGGKEFRELVEKRDNPVVVEFARTPDDIEAVYTWGKPTINGRHFPTSCMSYGPEHFESGIHPVRVYGAGDLAVAFIHNSTKERIVARCLCWPERLRHGIIYGADLPLRHMLEALGYTRGSMRGARLLKIPYDGGFVMPYIDDLSVSDDGGFFRIGGRIPADEHNGLLFPGVTT